MKLRCEMEVEVPDEVGKAVLAERAQSLVQYVKVDDRTTYTLEAPLVWKQVDTSAD